jgi:hypothetical protein
MSDRAVFAPHLGRTVRMGRIRPDPASRKLRMADYLAATLPTPPAAADYTPKARAALANMYLNDQLGDCVIADAWHAEGIVTGNVGQVSIASAAQIVADYSAIGGYVPGRPRTDQGCDPETALNYYTKVGYADGNKLAGWMAADATDRAHIALGLYLFENASLSVELPDAWVNQQMPQADGFTWDVAGPPDPANGHEICACGYTDRGVLVCTWGLIGTVTWAALARYFVPHAGGNVYFRPTLAMVSRATGRAPTGLSWPDLVLDFDALGGDIPPILPPPTPPGPDPKPTPGPDPKPTPGPDPKPTPAPGLVVIDTINRTVTLPPGVTATSRWIGSQVTYSPSRSEVAIPSGWHVQP